MLQSNTSTQFSRYDFSGLRSVVWGRPAVDICLDEIDAARAQRVAVVTSPSLRRLSETPDALIGAMDSKCVGIFDALQPHTPPSQVAELAKLLRETDADLVVSFGGGTPIDTVKIVLALLAAGESDPLALVDMAPNKDLPPIRQIACPTTLSGAEFSDLAGLTDTKTQVKHGVSGYGIGPAIVVLDPELTMHTPLNLWFATGMRAIDHAIETLCSIGATPYTDALAMDALRQLAPALRQTKQDPNDIGARLAAQQSVWMASAGLDRTPYGASHGIGHQLGAVAGLAHGICSCVLLPAVLEWNFRQTEAAQAKIAELLEADSAAEGIRLLLTDLGLPSRLSDVAVTTEQTSKIARSSVNNRWVKTNPRPLRTAADIETLLETAF